MAGFQDFRFSGFQVFRFSPYHLPPVAQVISLDGSLHAAAPRGTEERETEELKFWGMSNWQVFRFSEIQDFTRRQFPSPLIV